MPAEVASGCLEAAATPEGAVAAAACTADPSLLPPGTTATVTYYVFDHFRSADIFFGDQLGRLGDQFGEDCSVEPSHYIAEVDGEVIGRVLCAGDPAAGDTLEAVWRDHRFDALGVITLDGGSYADLGALLAAAQLQP